MHFGTLKTVNVTFFFFVIRVSYRYGSRRQFCAFVHVNIHRVNCEDEQNNYRNADDGGKIVECDEHSHIQWGQIFLLLPGFLSTVLSITRGISTAAVWTSQKHIYIVNGNTYLDPYISNVIVLIGNSTFLLLPWNFNVNGAGIGAKKTLSKSKSVQNLA